MPHRYDWGLGVTNLLGAYYCTWPRESRSPNFLGSDFRIQTSETSRPISPPHHHICGKICMDCDCGWFLETSLLQWLMLLSRCLRSFLAHFRRSADLKKTFQSSQGGAFCNSNGRKCLPTAGGWTLVLVFFLHQSFLRLGHVSCICKVHWEISTRHLRNCDPVHEQK